MLPPPPPTKKETKIVSLLILAHVKRFSVSYVRHFFLYIIIYWHRQDFAIITQPAIFVILPSILSILHTIFGQPYFIKIVTLLYICSGLNDFFVCCLIS